LGTVTPEQVAHNVIAAIRSNRPYVYSDDHSRTDVEDRLSRMLAARDDVIVLGEDT
jgi:hypothetical protein